MRADHQKFKDGEDDDDETPKRKKIKFVSSPISNVIPR